MNVSEACRDMTDSLIWNDMVTNLNSLFCSIRELLVFVLFLFRGHILEMLPVGRNTVPLMDSVDKRRAPTNALILCLPCNGILRFDFYYEEG